MQFRENERFLLASEFGESYMGESFMLHNSGRSCNKIIMHIYPISEIDIKSRLNERVPSLQQNKFSFFKRFVGFDGR